MFLRDLYTKAILTVIAGLLACHLLVEWRGTPVHAQPASPQYAVEVVSADWASKQYPLAVATSINAAATGRELVAVVPYDQAGKYLAVYRRR